MTAQSIDNTSTGELKSLRTAMTVMAAILVSGFILQLALGRSSFASPLVVHLHAVTFMGWVAITVTQVRLAASGNRALHQRLGGLAVAWACAMAVLGPLVTINAMRTGRVPFFFQPQHLLLADPASLIGFLGLFGAAVALRGRKDWHTRLQIGAFMMLLGPGIGRILPMPLLAPWAFECAGVVSGIVGLAVMALDVRRTGRVHPAWAWSFSVLVATLVLARVIAFSPAGDAIYAAATAGSPYAGSDGRAFPPPPGH